MFPGWTMFPQYTTADHKGQQLQEEWWLREHERHDHGSWNTEDTCIWSCFHPNVQVFPGVLCVSVLGWQSATVLWKHIKLLSLKAWKSNEKIILVTLLLFLAWWTWWHLKPVLVCWSRAWSWQKSTALASVAEMPEEIVSPWNSSKKSLCPGWKLAFISADDSGVF